MQKGGPLDAFEFTQQYSAALRLHFGAVLVDPVDCGSVMPFLLWVKQNYSDIIVVVFILVFSVERVLHSTIYCWCLFGCAPILVISVSPAWLLKGEEEAGESPALSISSFFFIRTNRHGRVNE